MDTGDPMMIPCIGGPSGWRTATYPPAVEVAVDDGVYVLVDDGPPETWTYEYVAAGVDA